MTGINAIIYYADTIFAAAGFTSVAGQTAATTWAIGGVNVLATLIAVAFVDRLGRKPLLVAGLIGMAVSLTVVGIAFMSIPDVATGVSSSETATGPSDAGIITLVALVVSTAASLMLADAGLLVQPLLYLSRYFIETKSDYYRLLLKVTAEQAWEDWILYVLKGVTQSSIETTTKIRDITTLQDRFAHTARATSRGSADSELQSVLFEQPYCRISTVMARCEVSRPTAVKWLDALVSAGVLTDVKVGRDRLFINHDLLELLGRR